MRRSVHQLVIFSLLACLSALAEDGALSDADRDILYKISVNEGVRAGAPESLYYGPAKEYRENLPNCVSDKENRCLQNETFKYTQGAATLGGGQCYGKDGNPKPCNMPAYGGSNPAAELPKAVREYNVIELPPSSTPPAAP